MKKREVPVIVSVVEEEAIRISKLLKLKGMRWVLCRKELLFKLNVCRVMVDAALKYIDECKKD